MLGLYDEAHRVGQRALRVFEKYGDQLAAGKIEMNLSNVVSRRDQYRLAEKYCLSAYKRFAKLGETSWQTMAENGLANTYAELNEFDRAEKFYARALERARAGRMRLTVAEIEASMGNLALSRGEYAGALRRLERSRQMYEKLGMPHQTAIADLEIADIYAELNLIDEATEMYRVLVVTLRALKMRGEEARARRNFGQALAVAGQLRESRAELKRASSLFELEKNSIAAASVDLRRASVEAAEGNYEDSLAIVTAAYPKLRDSGNVRLELSARWLHGHLLSKLDRHDESESLLADVLKRSRYAGQTAIAQMSMNSLGVVAKAKGDLARAARLFDDAIRSAEAARAPLPGEEFRMAFFAKTLEPYRNLAGLYLEQGDLRSAFVCFERARSRSLIESTPARTKRETSAKIREELNWYYSRLDRAEEGEVEKFQKEIRDRERLLAAEALRSQSTSSRRGVAVASGALNVDELQRRLGPGKALVEFVADDGVYSAFVIANTSIDHVPDLASESEVMSFLEGLHFQFGSLFRRVWSPGIKCWRWRFTRLKAQQWMSNCWISGCGSMAA
jgi:tetratricopeptide (TPR) repeat protein